MSKSKAQKDAPSASSIIVLCNVVIENGRDQMSYLRKFRPCVFAVAFMVAGLISASPALAHSVMAQLEEITVKWVEAFKQGDFVTIEGFHAPDALLLPPNSPAIQGRQAIGEMWKSWRELPNVEISFGAVKGEASSSGDMAYEYGTYIFAYDTDSGRITDKGKYVTVWKKIGGAWQVMTDIFNSNLPAE